MRIAANLTMMFPEMDLLQKYEKAAELGFQLVEVSLPYGWPMEKLQEQAEHYRLKHILINAPAGDWSKGFRGLAALSEQKSKYIESLNIAVQYAKKLNVQKVHVMAGIAEQTDENFEVYVENIRLACQQFKKDLFHAQQICGQLTTTIETLAPFTGHIQVAQVPGRHEPDTDGEINYSYVFNVLKKFGDWDVGCEYLNSGCDNQYLQWVYRYGLTF
ncbi:unnamed protein product [Onchocerca ochengi]|uniref:Hydroxypyruvate isomerase n=1 Tax=Onchocerca ochengi TaxID=42157 RepID=A0A182EN57_ONCOC|nr:unnamed protein product [Onchocerca ochengi]VDM93078.1 unnamed protein product [Onchocerca ochengi]